MKEKFDKELNELKKDAISMGELSENMLKESLDVLMTQDIEKANKIINHTGMLLEADDKIEDKALRMIALYQPMAVDMRTIACILKMITYLARIGRYGKDISVITKLLSDAPRTQLKLGNIKYMGKLVTCMISDVIKAFETGNLELISEFSKRDDEVDDLMVSVIRECLTYMMEDPKNITRCTRYIMVAKYLERCGDHACKAAEKIHYMVTGKRVEIN